MKTTNKIAIWALVAVAGALLLGGGIWWWLIGLFVARLVIRIILSCLVTLLTLIGIFGGLFWILIS